MLRSDILVTPVRSRNLQISYFNPRVSATHVYMLRRIALIAAPGILEAPGVDVVVSDNSTTYAKWL